MTRTRKVLIWGALMAAMLVPLLVSATSPLLAWRSAIYIAAGFAGVSAMALLLLQPILAGGYLPDLSLARSRRLHRWVGAGLVALVVIHVGALWITSPPDVVDALLFRSATPFSVWGVTAMWAIFAAAALATVRRRISIRPRTWRMGHTVLVSIAVIGSVVHAMLIEGTMEIGSKIALCLFVLAATGKVVTDLAVWARRR